MNKMNNIVIEKLNKADLIEAISIYDENHKLKTNYKKSLQEYDKIYNNPDYHNVVAKLNGKIVGLATIIINHDIVEDLKPFLTVWNLGVHKDFRRKKVGTELLKYINNFAKEKDCQFIALLAEKDNLIAQQFYENSGFSKELGYVKFIK